MDPLSCSSPLRQGTDGERVGIIAGSFDGAVAFRVQAEVATIVAGGDHDCDARSPGFLNLLAQRVECVALVDGAAQGEIDDSDVVRGLERNGLIDSLNDRGVGTNPVFVKNAQVDEVGVGSDAR